MQTILKVKGKVPQERVSAVEQYLLANLSEGYVVELTRTKVLLRKLRETEIIKERDLPQVGG